MPMANEGSYVYTWLSLTKLEECVCYQKIKIFGWNENNFNDVKLKATERERCGLCQTSVDMFSWIQREKEG